MGITLISEVEPMVAPEFAIRKFLNDLVGDTANIKRTSVEYRTYFGTTIAEYGLVSAVNVFDTDQATVPKRFETDYDLSSGYVDRRIIGLPPRETYTEQPPIVGSHMTTNSSR